ncbi:MFS transporter [Actinacidiphila acididurans]|uniref:MFS transporter n=1 Tax=Actinacidiphila acididurans TaxID=2784346 RepID=A0ABS2TT22_9ACTN|nr:MFS transporter [Actinacidiphila acididurans]MBM9506146.1 MFS transporter [Actinacidiphila acididurans]
MERSLRAARAATFVYFVLSGTLMGTWVVHIPAVEDRVGVSHATLGGLLVLLGAGAFAGMQTAGPMADRLGARVVVPTAGVLCSAALVLPGLARGPWALAGALLVFGFANGCLDVSMNAHAVHVEKAYRRPVMSSFHATFSVGGVIAAVLGAGAAGAGMSLAVTLDVSAAVGLLVALVAARSLMPTVQTTATSPDEAEQEARPRDAKRRSTRGGIWILAVLAFMTMLCEGAANDWSALHLKDVLGAPASVAAVGYGTFAAAMTIGRLLADRLSARFGAMAILRYGAVLAAAGITIAAFAPWIWTAFAGWALFGLGLSGCVPQLFSAAGHADPAAAGANVSRVAGLGYLGMLAGPAVIGWLTHLVALNHTFLLLTLLCLVTAAAAGILRTADRTADGTAHHTPEPAPDVDRVPVQPNP